MDTLKNTLKKHLVRGLFMGMFAILLLRTGGTSVLALAQTCGQWRVVSTTGQGFFNAVAAVPGKPKDVWAVGGDPNTNSLIEHWNGKSWHTVSSPNITTLTAITAITASDIWAMGGTGSIIHWNGKHWSIVSSPPNVDQLAGATALATNNVWAVGYSGPGINNTPVIEHWDGTQWSIIGSPNVSGILSAVSAVSANDIWATGYNYSTGVILAEHWDGTQWSIVPTASITGCLINTTDIVAIATNDVWIVGSELEDCGSRVIALSEHWDGTQWTSVGVPSPGKGPYRMYYFNAIAATASNNIWAVGGTTDPKVGPVPLTERWDGTQWNVIPQTNLGEMYGVTTTSAGKFWAVGYNPKDQSAPPLAEFYC